MASSVVRPSPAGRRLRIGLTLRSNKSWTGGTHYVLTWLRALNSLPLEERPEVFLLYTHGSARADARELQSSADGIAHLSQARALELDFVYPVKEFNEAPVGVPWGGWIVDWQQRYLPELFNAAEHRHRELRYRLMARHAPVLVLSSQMALDDTKRWVAQPHAPLAKLHFPALLEPDLLALDPDPVRRTYKLPRRYLMVCNQWYRHKDHVTVVEALALLRRNGLEIPCAFTGLTRDHRWPDYFRRIKAILRENRMGKQAKILGQVSRADQLALVRGAAAVIQPSLFEGWSTIVEEGRALGKLMILSDIPVHREQAPPGCRFFEAGNVESLAAKIEEVWQEGETSAEEASERERQALARHHRSVEDAGRELVRVARLAGPPYRPELHDPTVGLVALARMVQSGDADLALARQYVVAATRSMLHVHPWQYPRLVRLAFAADRTTARFVLTTLTADLIVDRLARVKRRALRSGQAFTRLLSPRRAVRQLGGRRKLVKRARRAVGRVPGALPLVRRARKVAAHMQGSRA